METKQENDLEISREKLHELIKKYGIKDTAVLLKSSEINDEINKEMRSQINMKFELKIFVNKNVMWLQSKNYSIIYKDYKVYTGLIIKDDKTLWFECANKTFYTNKEAINYLMDKLEYQERNSLII